MKLHQLYFCLIVIAWLGFQVALSDDEQSAVIGIVESLDAPEETATPVVLVTTTTTEVNNATSSAPTTLAPTTSAPKKGAEKSSPSMALFAILIGSVVILLFCLLYYLFFGRRDAMEAAENIGAAKSIRRTSAFKSVRMIAKSPQEQPTAHPIPRQPSNTSADLSSASPAPTTVRSALTDASQLMAPVVAKTNSTSSGTATVQSPATSESRSPSPIAAASKVAGTKSTVSNKSGKKVANSG